MVLRNDDMSGSQVAGQMSGLRASATYLQLQAGVVGLLPNRIQQSYLTSYLDLPLARY